MSAPNSAGYVTDVAYVPGFYPHLAPKALRHVAILNRIKPPAVVDGFKYLEPGCGLGRTLTTLAAANPRGSFVGVDLNPAKRAMAERFGMTHFVNPSDVEGDLVPHLVNMTKRGADQIGGADYTFD